MIRNASAAQYEAGADVRFGRAMERLAEQDAARREWLDRHLGDPDMTEEDVHPEDKASPAPGRCKRWGCHRKIRCKGLCSTHYFTAKSRERRST